MERVFKVCLSHLKWTNHSWLGVNGKRLFFKLRKAFSFVHCPSIHCENATGF